MKKRSFYIIVLILLIAIGLICGIILQKPKQDTIKIGALLPITGPISDIGESYKNGIEIALENYNNDPNHKQQINIIFEDSMGTAGQGVIGINKLISVNKIDYAFIGPTQVVSATSPIIFDNKIPTFIITPSPGISNNNTYMYNFFSYTSDYGEIVAKDLNSKQISGVSLIVYASDAGTSFVNAFKKTYTGKYTLDTVNLEQQDFRTEILKAKNNDLNAIVFVDFPGPNIIFLNELLQLNVSISTYIMFGNEDNINKSAKDSLKIIEPYASWFVFSDKAYPDFIKKYEIKYNKTPYAESAYAYNSMSIMLQVIDECGRDKVCFNKKVMTTEFTGGVVKDSIRYDENRNAIIGTNLIKYDENKETWVDVK